MWTDLLHLLREHLMYVVFGVVVVSAGVFVGVFLWALRRADERDRAFEDLMLARDVMESDSFATRRVRGHVWEDDD